MKKVLLVSLTIVLFITVACHSSMKVGDTRYKKADATAGQAIYETGGKCAKCHKPKNVDSYTPEKWTGILKSMVPKAKLDENETRLVTAYVMVNSKKG
jgi:mono/diheme cytochrome c family protein